MRCFLISILSLSFAITAFAQVDSLGFTNKAEAENKMVHGRKEGKWIEYYYGDGYMYYQTTDTSEEYYNLAIYRRGRRVGISRGYYGKSGKLFCETPYVNGKKNGVEKIYYTDGSLHEEFPNINGKKNGIVKEYNEDGTIICECAYVNGKKNGIERVYYKKDTLERECSYKRDIENGVEKF